MRRSHSLLLSAARIALLLSSHAAFAQLIPWAEPPAIEAENKIFERPKPPLRRAARIDQTAPDEAALKLPPSAPEIPLIAALGQLLPSSSGSILLSSFDGTVGSGSIRADSSWGGNVTQNPSSITVAGSAVDDNGWRATNLSLDASGMNFLTITAQRDAGNLAKAIAVQFEDRDSRTKVFSVSTSLFAVGTPTTVQLPLTGWTIDFGASSISTWSIGGGSVGTEAIRMTFDEFTLSASAIPEPGTYAALLGAGTLVLAAWCRRRRAGSAAPKRLS